MKLKITKICLLTALSPLSLDMSVALSLVTDRHGNGNVTKSRRRDHNIQPHEAVYGREQSAVVLGERVAELR